MKHLLFFLMLAVAVAGPVAGQSVEDVLREAEQLIDERQYDSAFELLAKSEVESTRILAKQIDIVTQYFVTSIMHQMFALADLAPGQNLQDLRRSEGEFTMRLFDPAAWAEPVLEQQEAPEVAASLAHYFDDAINRYGNDWVMPIEQAREKVIDYTRRALAGGAGDQAPLSSAATFLLQAGNSAEAADLFEASFAVDPDHAPAHYNYAIALGQTGRPAEGLEHAMRAAELYEYAQYQADSYVLVGQLRNALGQSDQALAAFELAAQTAPGYHYPHQFLITEHLGQGRVNAAQRSAAVIIAAEPTNPTTPQIVISLYNRARALEHLVTALAAIAEQYEDNPEARGNILFHKAEGHFRLQQFQQGRRTLIDARDLFRQVYDEDHPVFGEIERALKETAES
jgi:tetratricopeptide (TPR) repeat protein